MKESVRESEEMEFKLSLTEWRDIVETVSAFSNTKGGMIKIGVADDGEIIGTTVGKNTIEKLANQIKQNTDPLVFPSIVTEEKDGKEVIVIHVKEGESKPVFAFGRAFKRVGKTNQRLGHEDIRKLSIQTSKVYWDGQICKGTELDDIDWDFIKEVFIPLYEKISEKKVAGKPIDLLRALGTIKKGKPTNAGILLFGKDSSKFFLNSHIALGRYIGKAVSGEKLDYKEFVGNLFEQIDKCTKYIVEHTALMSRLIPGEVRRTDIPEYGLFSIRELITNAVCHRDYEERGGKIIIKMFDDRIEFYNIGGLPAGVTPKNITTQQSSRNPIIAGVLAKVKYIEEMGEGWDKIIEEHIEHPLDPKMPAITSSENGTLVTLFSTKEKFEKKEIIQLNKRQKKALEYVNEHRMITNRDYRELFPEITSRTVLNDLNDLVDKGLLQKEGKTKNAYYIIPK